MTLDRVALRTFMPKDPIMEIACQPFASGKGYDLAKKSNLPFALAYGLEINEPICVKTPPMPDIKAMMNGSDPPE